jgi:hypothetical protein
MKTYRLVLNLADDGVKELYEKVLKALEEQPDRLEIDLIGLGHQKPNSILMVWDMLMNRSSKTVLSVHARTSLFDGSLLLLLMADERKVRPLSWVQLDSPTKLKETDWAALEDKATRRGQNQIHEPTFVTDYYQIAELMNEYIPVEKIAGQRWPLENLREYGLLLDSQEEKAFQDCFK